MKSLRVVPQQTLISALREKVLAWRQGEGLTIEAVAIEIVKHYYDNRYNAMLDIEFQTGEGGDVYRAARSNADRISRWLDDVGKTNVLLPANLVPVVMGALPMRWRLAFAADLLAPLGLEVSIAKTSAVEASLSCLLASLAKESGEGIAAFGQLLERTNPSALQEALIELEESGAATAKAKAMVLQLLEASKCQDNANSRSAG